MEPLPVRSGLVWFVLLSVQGCSPAGLAAEAGNGNPVEAPAERWQTIPFPGLAYDGTFLFGNQLSADGRQIAGSVFRDQGSPKVEENTWFWVHNFSGKDPDVKHELCLPQCVLGYSSQNHLLVATLRDGGRFVVNDLRTNRKVLDGDAPWLARMWWPGSTLQTLNGLRLSPDGKVIAVVGLWRVMLWDLVKNRQIGFLNIGNAKHGKRCSGFAFSVDSKYAATLVDRDQTEGRRPEQRIEIWKIESLGKMSEIDADGRLLNLALSRQGEKVAGVAAGREHVVVWDVGSGKLCRKLAVPDRNQVPLGVGFTSDRTLIAYCGRPPGAGAISFESVAVWDLELRKATLIPRKGDYRCLAVSPDGRELVGAEDKGLIPLLQLK